MKEITAFLKNCSLFSGLSPSQLHTVGNDFPWRVIVHEKDSVIGLPGDTLTSLQGVVHGEVGASITDEKGNVFLVETLGAGSIIAGPLLFSNQPMLPVQIIVLVPTQLAVLDKEVFLGLLSSHPQVLRNLLSESGDKINFLAEKIRLLQFDSLEEKIAGWFLRQNRLQNPDRTNSPGYGEGILRSEAIKITQNTKHHPEITLPITQNTLASMLGVTRPALSRCLGELHNEGYITRLGRGRYRVNVIELKKIIGG